LPQSATFVFPSFMDWKCKDGIVIVNRGSELGKERKGIEKRTKQKAEKETFPLY
jgi:hypothetical protein